MSSALNQDGRGLPLSVLVPCVRNWGFRKPSIRRSKPLELENLRTTIVPFVRYAQKLVTAVIRRRFEVA